MGLNTAGTFSILLCLATSAAVFAQAPPDAQRRLLCAQLGGDLADPGEMAAFKRCLANPPAPASPPKPAPYAAPAPFERPAVALGAGVNKGNVDNTGGPRYLYFIAGPGHVDVKMAFKEMSVMGAPLRQTLNFDMFDEQGHLISHNALSSLDQLERLSIPGNFVNKMRTTMVISAPAGLVRLGGYYEVEVDGAVQFDPSAPSTADIKPENTDLVSDARAGAVKAWLVDTEKLPPTGLVTQGFGAAKPVAHNTKPDGSDDPAGRQLNRRVELVLTK